MESGELSLLNPHPKKLPGPDLLHHLVRPPCDASALEYLCDNKRISLTYEKLHAAADVLAAKLSHARGDAGYPAVVPVLLPQSPYLYVALLAILKAGCAFCPLDINAPPARIDFILEDVDATVIVAAKGLAHLIPFQSSVKVIFADVDQNYSDRAFVKHCVPDPADLAYVMYTSGSTGTPKGVGLSHSAATQALLAHENRIPQFSRFLQFAAPTFDVSVFEIFFPLFRGGTLISVDRKEMLDDLPRVISEMNVDACELTPTVAASLLRTREHVPTLRLLLTIGEMLHVSVIQEFGGSDEKEGILWAMYGPTEATIHCTLQEDFWSTSSINNIGTPLDSVSCFIIEPADSSEKSASFKILPKGEIGELAVGGYQLADGYLNRPDQTASVFISSPYGRVYRTGDRARIANDGRLECLGRLSDGQVKLRGQRLELGEVQSAVLRTPGCHGAVAAVIESILVVFCAVDSGVTDELVRSRCIDWLPQYMVPGELVLMKDFPKLPSGKVDIKTLKVEFQSRRAETIEEGSFNTEQSEVEEKARLVISEVLNTEVHGGMKLTSVGVDSIVAIKLASSLRGKGFEVNTVELLRHQTISQFCSTLHLRQSETAKTIAPDNLSLLPKMDQILRSNPCLNNDMKLIEDILPCSPLQNAMLAESARDTQAYWNEVELETAIGLTTKDVVDSIHKIVSANEILRGGFVEWNGGFIWPIFNSLRNDQVQVVDDFHELQVAESGQIFQPLRIQIKTGVLDRSSRILIHIHHAIYDGWSMDIILSDLSCLLSGKVLSPRPQFRDVLHFYRNLQDYNLDHSRSFWAEHLMGWNKQPFPKLRNRLAELNKSISMREKFNIPIDVVQDTAREIGCSSQVLFQAALSLVWANIQGSSDVVIGSVTSGRTIPVDGIEGILGPCIASLPLRINLDRADTVVELLLDINSSNHSITEHSQLQLSEIKRLTGLQSSENLYDILFVYQESLYSRDRDKNLFKEIRHLDRLETKLLFEVEPHDNGFTLQATYHSEIFSSELITHFHQQVKEMFSYILHHSNAPIRSTKSLIKAEPSVHNAYPEKLDDVQDLAGLFEAAAARAPEDDAVCFGTSLTSTAPKLTRISFAALNKLSNQIARFILSKNVETGDVIAIIMEKSLLLYASILGIVKARCAYLPLLPSTPIERVKEIFRSGGIRICLVDGSSLSSIQDASNVRALEVDPGKLMGVSEENLDIESDLSRLAYVIYTSGTTGVPKGVAVSQRNIVSNVTYLASIYPSSRNGHPRLLQACSQAFDVSVFEIFFTWHAGMCLCAARNDDMFEDLEHTIRQFQITHLSLTPTVASLIDPKNTPTVEFLVTAGEPMTAAVLDKWGELLWQGYGPSETTNICSVKKMKMGEHIEHLGWVFPNTSIFVLVPGTLKTLPIGWVGEFCFGGEQIADGYLNMPDLTAAKFIEHPQYGRVYRSGDLGRMLTDGSLVILGRLDDQVKLRGQRIETSEVSSLITNTSFADAAVTILVQRQDGAADQLASFFVTSHGSENFSTLEVEIETHRSLLATVKSRLPSYMIPSYLIPVTRIPLTSSGKVDKRQLQSCFEGLSQTYIESASSATAGQDTGEWSNIEKSVADAISQSLKIARSGVDRWTPFASIGLDSISAIGVTRDLSAAIGSRVAISAVLQHSSVALLSRFIQETPKNNQEQTSIEYFSPTLREDVQKSFDQGKVKIAEILPCTPLQEAMLSYGHGSYCNKVLLRIRIGAERMKSYWDTMIERHSILRTCFVTTSDSKFPIVQVVLQNWTASWKEYSVTELSLDGATQDHLRSLSDPLDSNTPPISLGIIKYKGSVFLSIICHHALYDGVAMENLWREVEALANGKELLQAIPHADFVRKATSLPEDTDQFWINHLRNFVPVRFFDQSSRRQIDQCLHKISLDMPYEDIQNRHRSLGISLLSVCQAAWANVLALSSNVSDICFGSVISGRTLALEGIDRLVAPCFNTIPIRKDVSSASQNIELARSFQRLNSDMLHYQFTPLRQIQKVTGSQGHNLFDTLLLLQRPLQDMDEKIWTLEQDSGEMDIPVVCEVVPCPSLNSVVVNLHYDMNIVGEEIATALAETFKQTFQLILQHPFAAPAERRSLQPEILPLLDKLAAKRSKSRVTIKPSLADEKWSDTEIKIRTVFSKLSDVPVGRIRRDTSIYSLGLDSINAVQVASMVRRQGFVVSASDVIECQTCSKLAKRLLQTSKKNISSETYDLDAFSAAISSQVQSKLPGGADIEAKLPCTPLQSGLLASFVQSNGLNYLNMLSFEVNTIQHSVKDLELAWETLLASHPMLRTGFVAVQHQDATFAMVRYLFGSEILKSASLINISDNSVNLLKWKKEESANILGCLYLPPWRVVINQTGEGAAMHLLIHHALYDAQSINEIMHHLSRLLNNQASEPLQTIEPTLRYIMAQNLRQQDEARTFWVNKAESTVVNTFPVMTPLREQERRIISHKTTSSLLFSTLRSLTQRGGFTIQALIQAAWTRVLSSYLGEESVVFGVTWSGRTSDETRDAPFPCITTIPIIASNISSNAELIRYMLKYNTDVHKYQHSPLSQTQKWLGYPATPVFDTLLVYQELGQYSVSKRPWKLVNDDATVDYPVSIEVEPTHGGKIGIQITFFSDVLPTQQAELLVQQFDAMMAHIAYHPDGYEDGIYKARPELFSITPPFSPELPAPVNFLHQFVEERARLQPDKVALEFVSHFDGKRPVKRTWTYIELDAIGNRVANLLADVASVHSIVAIHFDKCPEAYFSILGILKAGCAFVALDPSAPKSRKEFILSDSESPCLLTTPTSTIDFDSNVKIINIDLELLRNYSAEKRDLGPQFIPSATSYCLYTSGTTGTPKGCEITHENSVQAMMAFQELFKGHWSEDSRWLQFAALHFDVSVLEQYWSWSVGITVVAAPRDLILDDLIESINRLEITHIDLTPSLARLTHPDEVPGLCKGVFITGGEQLKQEILDAWGPKAVIYNAYGPTEATIGVTMYQRVPINGRPSNIGKQFLNVGSYVFHKGTEIPVLRGAVGELCVSGRLVGKGYLNRPELTEERFPTLTEFGERIYRTGDLVRILHDGCFDFLGRADDQVKLRGQRLEIGEINHVVRTGVSGLRDVATLVLRHGSSGKDVLVSFLVGSQQSKGRLEPILDDDELGSRAREACRMKLPSYMIPTYFLIIPYIPLSPNNKVEAKELKQLFNSLTYEQLVELTKARTSTRKGDSNLSKQIVKVLAGFSGVEQEKISDDMSIFDLGVDSISALQLSTIFKNEGFGECSPSILLRNPIISDLAVALSDATSLTSKDDLVREAQQTIRACLHQHRAFVCHALRVDPSDIEYIAPCSALQQGIISKSMTDEVRGTYFNSFELLLQKDTSMGRLQSAWRNLISTHSVLRTVFVKTIDGYIQAALKDSQLNWQEHVLNEAEDEASFLQTKMQEWVQQNNDHIITPLKFIILKTPNAKKLIIQIFHAIYDGNSFELMLQNLNALYSGAELPHVPSFLEALSHGPLWRHDECRHFWETHLLGWKMSAIPHLASSNNLNPVATTRRISGVTLERIRKKYNVTLQSVVMALWVSVLQTHVPEGGLTIGLVLSGRSINLPDVDKTVGPLFNTVPFFNKTLQGQNWNSLIHKCHQFSTAILSFQHVPLKSIQQWCSGRRPLFDNLFVFEIERQIPSDESRPWAMSGGPLNPDYPLALEAKKLVGGDIQLSLVARASVAAAADLEVMLDQIQENMVSMADNKLLKAPISQISNGHTIPTKPDLLSDSSGYSSDFEWTEGALKLRDEVATFVGINAEEITEAKTILELGLDSIDVIQLSARLRQRGLNLPASQIMRQLTIPRMVLSMESSQTIQYSGGSLTNLLEEIKKELYMYAVNRGLPMDSVETVLPPTPLQDSMVAGMVHSDFEWYFNHDLLEIRGGVDQTRLMDAWSELIRQSPILRTGFLEVDDPKLEVGYCQIVYRHSPIKFEGKELESLSQVSTLMGNTRKAGKDRSALHGVLQLQFLACGERQFIIVTIAHALYDGFSLGLIYRNLEAIYHGESLIQSPVEPFLQRVLASSTDDTNHFWASYLDGVSPTLFPEIHDSGSSQSSIHRHESISERKIPTVLDFCKRLNISLQVLCQACWALVLADRTRVLDVTFGVVLSGRDFDGAENLVFPTMNTVALRCILHGTSSAFLKYLESSMMEIREHQAYPLRKIQAKAKLSGAQLFNTLFMLQKSIHMASLDPLLKSVDGFSAVDYPICVEAEVVGNELVWRAACQSQYFNNQDAGNVVKDLDRVLEFMIDFENSEILEFQDSSVSICGLSPITISDDIEAIADIPDVPAISQEEFDKTALIIREVLSHISNIPVEAIRAETSLYHLGLDSISAIKVSSLLRTQGIHINVRDLIRAKGVLEMSQFATQISQVQDHELSSTYWSPSKDMDVTAILANANISKGSIEAVLPALPMQVYMITAWQNAEGSVFFPEFRYRVDGNVGIEAIYEAWKSVVKQTPILRTVFAATNYIEQPFLQVVLKPDHERTNEECNQPLVKFGVDSGGHGDEIIVKLRIHHALYDGFSLPHIMKQFSDVLSGMPITSANEINGWLSYTVSSALEESRQARKEFWIRYLRGISSSDFQESSPIGITRTSRLKKSALSSIKEVRSLAQEHGIGLQAVFFAAYAKSLLSDKIYDGNNTKTIVFGIYLANKPINHELAPTYPTLNLVPLKVTITDGATIIDIAISIQADLHLITEDGRADVGLWEIAAWTGVKIASFVNFLSLPDDPAEVSSTSSSVKLDPVSPELQPQPTLHGEDESTLSQSWVRNNVVRDACPAAVDIEASINGQRLDIGVFGSQKRISEVEAVDLVDNIVHYLKTASGDMDVEEDDVVAWASSWSTGQEYHRK